MPNFMRCSGCGEYFNSRNLCNPSYADDLVYCRDCNFTGTVLAALTDVKYATGKGVALAHLVEQLLGVVSSLPKVQVDSFRLAKDACEAINDSARHADDAGCTEVAERLRCVNRMLSSVCSN